MGREVINISLSPEMKKQVDDAVKSGKFSSRSEYFRHLMRVHIDANLKDISDAEQKDIETRYGEQPSQKRSRGYYISV